MAIHHVLQLSTSQGRPSPSPPFQPAGRPQRNSTSTWCSIQETRDIEPSVVNRHESPGLEARETPTLISSVLDPMTETVRVPLVNLPSCFGPETRMETSTVEMATGDGPTAVRSSPSTRRVTARSMIQYLLTHRLAATSHSTRGRTSCLNNSFIRSEETRLNSSHITISYAVFC